MTCTNFFFTLKLSRPCPCNHKLGNMDLQAELITRIDDFGGIEKIIKDLKKHEKTAPWNRKIVFSGMSIFLRQLYKGKINLEWCALGHRRLSNFIIRYYGKWGARKHCETLSFVSELIKYKMESLKNIKELV